MNLKWSRIIGSFLALCMLMLAIPGAYAIYSPEISGKVTVIKQHAFQARQLNGTGSPRHAIQKLFDARTFERLREKDRADREQGKVTGISGQFHQLNQQAKADAAKDALGNYGESFALLFNYLPAQTEGGNGARITSCLRDDIFELQNLRDAVLTEALRSAILINREQAVILWNDYKDLRAMVALLKTGYAETSLFFPEGTNYYMGACPQGGFWGEFALAFEDLKRSWDTFATLGTAQNAQWGSIWEMAKRRAKVRARQWIVANQLTLTFAGPEGGSATSWVKREGIGGIGAEFETQLGIVRGFFNELIRPLFNSANYQPPPGTRRDVNSILRDVQSALEEKTVALVQAETAIQLNLEFNGIAENNLKSLQQNLFMLNAEIKRATESFGDQGGKALPTLCDQMRTILQKHCPNKGGDIPACQ